MGYTNVYCFEGGIPEWRSFGYPVEANKEYATMKVRKISPAKLYKILQKDDKPFILDVRPIAYESDRENIFIKGAHICPMVYLADWIDNIPKDKKIVITDWTNKKAIIAAKFLTQKGFDVLGILKGGIVRWKEEKLPLEHVEIIDGFPQVKLKGGSNDDM